MSPVIPSARPSRPARLRRYVLRTERGACMDWLGWIPEPVTLDVLVWWIFVVPVVVFGVPVVLACDRVPRGLELHGVPEDELSDAQRWWFTDVGLRLRELGF